MAKGMGLGQGGRFAAMTAKIQASGKSKAAAKAIAAAVGRKKYGKAKFQKMAAKGRKRAGGKKRKMTATEKKTAQALK